MSDFHEELATRLTRYAAIDSQSDDEAPGSPSTAVQMSMLTLLRQELLDMGAADVTLTDYGTVLATIPGTAPGPTVGFLAHVDTAPQFNATGVKPRLIRGYNGGAISFPDNPALTLTPEHNPYLATKVGHDIITASGLTLLGADDKAGIAIIMTAARHLLQNPDIPHPTLRLAFTPDEEIGRGVNPKLPQDLRADFAYTFDGGAVGEIEYESFSADGAVVTITGVSAHPGYSKGKMVNALTLAAKMIHMLPAHMTPELTEGREGFIHLTEQTGSAAQMQPQIHPARLRTRRTCRQRRPFAPDRRHRRRHRSPRHDRGCDQAAIPQHALLAGKGHDACDPCPDRRAAPWP